MKIKNNQLLNFLQYVTSLNIVRLIACFENDRQGGIYYQSTTYYWKTGRKTKSRKGTRKTPLDREVKSILSLFANECFAGEWSDKDDCYADLEIDLVKKMLLWDITIVSGGVDTLQLEPDDYPGERKVSNQKLTFDFQ